MVLQCTTFFYTNGTKFKNKHLIPVIRRERTIRYLFFILKIEKKTLDFETKKYCVLISISKFYFLSPCRYDLKENVLREPSFRLETYFETSN